MNASRKLVLWVDIGPFSPPWLRCLPRDTRARDVFVYRAASESVAFAIRNGSRVGYYGARKLAMGREKDCVVMNVVLIQRVDEEVSDYSLLGREDRCERGSGFEPKEWNGPRKRMNG